jgi:glycogen debranching enzyme
VMPILRDIISWHDRGTRYNIHVDDDGLLYAGEAGLQLTWMDAKVGDWVVTPRQGKAVEINALWYNALMVLSELSERYLRVSDSTMLAERAKDVKRNFVSTFWSDEHGYLFDYVDGIYTDAALRPNQIFALSLPFPLLDGEKAKSVLQIVEEKLLTPVGLRSLSPDDAEYRPHYGGNQLQRDGAYHQGTIWSWFLGPMASAIVAVEGEAGIARAKQILEAIKPHLADACVGSISEIFDADAPFAARGCCAQAWGVGEILRAYIEDAHQIKTSRDETLEKMRSPTSDNMMHVHRNGPGLFSSHNR